MESPCLIVVLGTRAQLVKMASVILAAQNAGVRYRILLTGQHRESMLDLASDLGIGPVFPSEQLAQERSSVWSLLGWAPGALLDCMRRVKLIKNSEANCCVVVHGDTLSTLIGAIAAKRARIDIAHIESGLSSGSLLSPFPEELIRRLVFRLTDFAFCPGPESTRRMTARNTPVVVDTGGNTIIDAIRGVVDKASHAEAWPPGRIVVSVHRFENIMRRRRLTEIAETVVAISQSHQVMMVLHPPTEKRLARFGLIERLRAAAGVQLLPRMSYSRFMGLVAGADLVLTDGGSNQEELSLLGVPTIVLRDRSERDDGFGENAILESTLPCSLVEYVAAGRYQAQRRENSVARYGSPSKLIIDTFRERYRQPLETA